MGPKGISQYAQVNVETSVNQASPHRLIQMLYEGALKNLAIAKGALEAGKLDRKGQFINKTIAIIGSLEEVLDQEKGGEIADNLESLYQYMQEALFEANSSQSPQKIDEVMLLLRELKEAWDAIDPKSR